MLRAALRDLQWRRRRFAITIVGTALVFAMSLLMSGLSNSFVVEVDRTLHTMAADRWVTRDDAAGAFSPGSFLTPDDIAVLTTARDGVDDAAPVLFGNAAAETAPDDSANEVLNVTVFGVVPLRVGAPHDVVSGTAELGAGEVLVPRSLGKHVGDSLRVGGSDFVVTGVVEAASLLAGTPTVTVTIEEAQRLLLGGQPLASMVVTSGVPALPDGYTSFTLTEARADLLRPMKNATKSIDFVKMLLWLVAALIVASVVYLTVLERSRDFAVFKATGVSNTAIGAGICLQAVIIAVVASILGVGLALLLAPFFPMQVNIDTAAMLTLPALAVVVGIAAGLIGVARTARVAPATAFGGP
jgi:putative ABC transport system permease protein